MRTLAQTRRWRRVLAARERFRADDLGTQAAALAFQAFLSLFPLMLLALAAAGFLLSGTPAEPVQRFFDAIPGIGPLLEGNLDHVVRARSGLGLLALAGVLWSASGLGTRAGEALGRIFRTRQPNLLRRRVRSLVSLLALEALLLGALVATGVAAGVRIPGPFGAIERAVSLLGVALLEFAFFLLSYRLLTPPGGPGIRDHVPGAIATTLGWNLLKLVGGLLVVRVASQASALYGTIGAVFGILVFLRVAASLYLGGAELSALRREERREPAGL